MNWEEVESSEMLALFQLAKSTVSVSTSVNLLTCYKISFAFFHVHFSYCANILECNYPMSKYPNVQISVCIFPVCMSPLRRSPSSFVNDNDVSRTKSVLSKSGTINRFTSILTYDARSMQWVLKVLPGYRSIMIAKVNVYPESL